jgi:hypothetical protein
MTEIDPREDNALRLDELAMKIGDLSQLVSTRELLAAASFRMGQHPTGVEQRHGPEAKYVVADPRFLKCDPDHATSPP